MGNKLAGVKGHLLGTVSTCLCGVALCKYIAEMTALESVLQHLQNALNLVLQKASEDIATLLQGVKMPEIHKKTKKVSYDITGIQMTRLVKPSSAVYYKPRGRLEWRLTGTEALLKGVYAYKYKHTVSTLSNHGSFEMKISGVDIVLDFDLGRTHSGLLLSDFTCTFGEVKMKFGGRNAWFYNRFLGVFERKFKAKMNSKVAKLSSKLIKEYTTGGQSKDVKDTHKESLEKSAIEKSVQGTEVGETTERNAEIHGDGKKEKKSKKKKKKRSVPSETECEESATGSEEIAKTSSLGKKFKFMSRKKSDERKPEVKVEKMAGEQEKSRKISSTESQEEEPQSPIIASEDTINEEQMSTFFHDVLEEDL